MKKDLIELPFYVFPKWKSFYIYEITVLFYSEKFVVRNFAMPTGVSVRKH